MARNSVEATATPLARPLMRPRPRGATKQHAQRRRPHEASSLQLGPAGKPTRRAFAFRKTMATVLAFRNYATDYRL